MIIFHVFYYLIFNVRIRGVGLNSEHDQNIECTIIANSGFQPVGEVREGENSLEPLVG